MWLLYSASDPNVIKQRCFTLRANNNFHYSTTIGNVDGKLQHIVLIKNSQFRLLRMQRLM